MKIVVAKNKADAFNEVKDKIFKINRQMEIEITEEKGG